MRALESLNAIADELPSLIAYLDAEERFHFVNRAHETWFRRPHGEFIDSDLRSVVGDEAYRQLLPYLQRALAGEFVNHQSRVFYDGAGLRWINATWVPHRPQEDVAGIFLLVNDVTQLVRQEAFNAALSGISGAFAASGNPGDAAHKVLAEIRYAVQAGSVILFGLDESGQALTLLDFVGVPDSAMLPWREVAHDPSLPAWMCVEGRQPVWVDDAGAWGERFPHLPPIAVDTALGWYPLLAGERVLGCLVLSLPGHGPLDDSVRQFLTLVSLQIGQALDRGRLQQREARATRRLEVLVQISDAFSRHEGDPSRIYRLLAEHLAHGLGDGCCVRIPGEGGILHSVAIAHSRPEVAALLERMEAEAPAHGASLEPIARVLNGGEAVFLPALTEKEAFRIPSDPSDSGEGVRVRGLLAVPLQTADGARGVVTVVRTAEGWVFDREDLTLLQDVCDRAAVILQNARLLAEVQETVRLREEFIAVASHELKTPITTVQLQLDLAERALLRPGSTAESVSAALDAARQAVARLTGQVDNLLGASRFDGARITLQRERVAIADLLRELPARFGGRVSLRLVRADERDMTADPQALDRILTNLITNAGKYGGGLPIDLEGRAGERFYQVSVRDHGPGIEPEHRERIFEKFFRSPDLERISGLGLGLYIARSLAEAHGGRLVVESEVGSGSTFTLSLPYA